jgi:hypothetical protein
MVKQIDSTTLFKVTAALVVFQAVVSLLFFQPSSTASLVIAIISCAAYSFFFWRRKQWARLVVILVSMSSVLLVLPHIQKHQPARLRGDFLLVPLAIVLLFLLFMPRVKEQFHARPLFF